MYFISLPFASLAFWHSSRSITRWQRTSKRSGRTEQVKCTEDSTIPFSLAIRRLQDRNAASVSASESSACVRMYLQPSTVVVARMSKHFVIYTAMMMTKNHIPLVKKKSCPVQSFFFFKCHAPLAYRRGLSTTCHEKDKEHGH